ncbi:MAG: helix-turn-helix domain-containing protein [Anaerovoracaceae bacterium]
MSETAGFTILFDDVIEDVGLIAASVYGIIWRYCQRRHRECYASQQTLADHLGITRQTLNKHLHTLIKAGYIEDVTPDTTGNTHTYHLTEKRDDRTVTVSNKGVKEIDTPSKKRLQPPVKNLDTRNTSEEQKKDIGDDKSSPRKRGDAAKSRKQRAVRKAVHAYFVDETKLTIPKGLTNTRKGSLWWNPIRELCELCEYDLGEAKAMIDECLRRLQGKTISDPNSIIKTARAVGAERKRGVMPPQQEPIASKRYF